jgi:hypothetical protein
MWEALPSIPTTTKKKQRKRKEMNKSMYLQQLCRNLLSRKMVEKNSMIRALEAEQKGWRDLGQSRVGQGHWDTVRLQARPGAVVPLGFFPEEREPPHHS